MAVRRGTKVAGVIALAAAGVILVLGLLAGIIPIVKSPQRPQRDLDLLADSIRQAIQSQPPNFITDQRFASTSQKVGNTWFWLDVTGSIHPPAGLRGDARQRDVYHRKLLARIRVNRKFRHLEPGVWYYWTAIDTSTVLRGRLASLYVPADSSLDAVYGYLSMEVHAHRHTQDSAAWRFGSDAQAWASCTMYGCCCGSHYCEKP